MAPSQIPAPGEVDLGLVPRQSTTAPVIPPSPLYDNTASGRLLRPTPPTIQSVRIPIIIGLSALGAVVCSVAFFNNGERFGSGTVRPLRDGYNPGAMTDPATSSADNAPQFERELSGDDARDSSSSKHEEPASIPLSGASLLGEDLNNFSASDAAPKTVNSGETVMGPKDLQSAISGFGENARDKPEHLTRVKHRNVAERRRTNKKTGSRGCLAGGAVRRALLSLREQTRNASVAWQRRTAGTSGFRVPCAANVQPKLSSNSVALRGFQSGGVRPAGVTSLQ